MSPGELPILYDYAVWANGRVLDAAATLHTAQWSEPRPAAQAHSFGSLRDTMVHVLSSELLWLRRWQGRSPREREVSAEDGRTVDELRARWSRAASEMHGFLRGLAPSDWQRVVSYTTLEGRPAAYPLWQMFLQVVNHGTHHRAEAASMLTGLGAAPLPLDIIFFFRERRLADQPASPAGGAAGTS
jgi:uncharacterized damage-inducible protein DinB